MNLKGIVKYFLYNLKANCLYLFRNSVFETNKSNILLISHNLGGGTENYLKQTDFSNFTFLRKIVCHGVPSPQIFSEYVDLQEKISGKKIVGFKFRDKKEGWTTPHRIFEYSDGTSCGELLNADAFNNLFQGTDCILRPSCFSCKYAGNQRISDISIADFWGIQNKHNDMFNENRGVSLILVNTDKGNSLFQRIKENQTMLTKKVLLADAQERNSPLLHPSTPYFDRNNFFVDYQKKGLEYCLKKYCSRSFFARLRRKIRRILKTKVLK